MVRLLPSDADDDADDDDFVEEETPARQQLMRLRKGAPSTSDTAPGRQQATRDPEPLGQQATRDPEPLRKRVTREPGQALVGCRVRVFWQGTRDVMAGFYKGHVVE